MAVVSAFVAAAAGAAHSLQSPPQIISTDPYADPTTQHQAEAEATAVGYGQTIVAAYHAGRGQSGGGSNVGWATSADGGTTWAHGFLPGITRSASPAGPYVRAEDASVAFDAVHGQFLIESSATVGSGISWTHVAIVVNRSADGLNWSLPFKVTARGEPDQSWITCDNGLASPYRGNCYVLWANTNGPTGGPLLASVSTDGGISWSPPRPAGGNAIGYSAQPVVQPDGTVVVIASSAASLNQIVAYRSSDGGATWSAPTPWFSVEHHRVPGGFREFPRPSVGVDAAGAIYLVWSDCRFSASCSADDLVIAVSPDGRKVPTIERVGAPSAGEAILPYAGVDPSTTAEGAKLGVVYYVVAPGCKSSTDCPFDVRFRSTSNGGASWSAPITLNTVGSSTWLPTTVNGRMIGDYGRIPVLDGTAVPVYIAPKKPDITLHSDLYAAVIPILRSPTPRLLALLSASGRAKLSAATVRPGTYRVVVADRSRTTGFRLRGPGASRTSSARFVGKATWTVHLIAGTYRYGPTRGGSQTLVVG